MAPSREHHEQLFHDLIDSLWNERRLDRFHDFFHPKVVFHGDQNYVGAEGLRDGFMVSFQQAFPNLRHEIVHLLIDGHMAAMRYHGTGTLQAPYEGLEPCGQKLDYHGTVIFRLAEGRIIELWGHADLGDWLSRQKDNLLTGHN